MTHPLVSRRRFLTVLGAVAAVPVLAACGGGVPPTAVPAKTAASAPAAAAATAPAADAKPTAAAAKPAAGGATGRPKMRFSTWLGAAKTLVQLYNEKQDKVEVTYEEIPFGQYADKLLIDMASGSAPDVFHWPSPWWIPAMRKKVFLPIDDLVKRDGIDLKAFAFSPERACTFDGKLWGMPYALPTTRIFMVNKRLFNQAGATLPTDAWTWDDLTAAATKIHKPPEAFAMAARQHQLNLESMILSNGGGIVSEDGKKSLLDKPESIEAMQMSVDWFLKYKAAMQPGDEKALGEDPFASDKLALGFTSIPGWAGWKRLTRDLKIDADAVDFPVSPRTKKRRSSAEVHTEAIAGKTKMADEAWRFFSWSQTNDDAMTTWLQAFPVNYRFEKYVEKITDPLEKRVTGLRFKYMGPMEVVYWGPNTSEGQKAFTAEYDLALLGKKPVDQAMKDASKALDNILKEA